MTQNYEIPKAIEQIKYHLNIAELELLALLGALAYTNKPHGDPVYLTFQDICRWRFYDLWAILEETIQKYEIDESCRKKEGKL